MNPKRTLPCNPYVESLPSYNAGVNIAVAQQASGMSDIAALASNENPYGCSPRVANALLQVNSARYSDPNATRLRNALAEKLGAAFDCTVVANGSEELIAAIARAFMVEGAEALTVVPSFGLHEILPLSMGGHVTKVAMTPDLHFDVAAICEALQKAPRVFFLSSPWNPVGATLSVVELQRIIAAARPETLFVFDEAYFEFRDQNAPDGLQLLRHAALHWVVLRTFSKAYGLAGLRVGYGVTSNAEIARLINAAHTPFNVNAMAQAAAVAALEDDAWMRQTVSRIISSREKMRQQLAQLGLKVAASQANFLFIKLPCTASEIARLLLLQGIIVKAWAEPGYTQFLRVSIGLPEENQRFINQLAQLLPA